jgi:hypothetical protein
MRCHSVACGTAQRIALESFLIAGRQIGDSHRKDRAARKLPASPLILVQSDNHREAPWLVMKCAREFWFAS